MYPRKLIKNKSKKNLHVQFKPKHLPKKSEVLQTLKAVLQKNPLLTDNEHQLLSGVDTDDTKLVQELLETGVNPNIVDSQQRNTLHIAVGKNYADIVQLLLHYHADPNAQDIIGNTPLHLAVSTSNLQIITLLLNAGADVRSLDLGGRNPLQLAESNLRILRRSWKFCAVKSLGLLGQNSVQVVESKLKILKCSWKSGAIEMIQLRDQLQQIVDVMLSMWRKKDRSFNTAWDCGTDSVDNLEMIKLSINSGLEKEMGDQMSQLQKELRYFCSI